MQGGTRPGENSESVRLSTPLQDLSAALSRGDAAFKMFRDFSICGLRELAGASLQGLTNSRSLTAMDLYDLPINDATDLLRQRRDISQPRIVEAPKACSPENFRDTAWTIAPGENVTLLVYGGRVVGVQKRSQQSPDPASPNP